MCGLKIHNISDDIAEFALNQTDEAETIFFLFGKFT